MVSKKESGSSTPQKKTFKINLKIQPMRSDILQRIQFIEISVSIFELTYNLNISNLRRNEFREPIEILYSLEVSNLELKRTHLQIA